MPGIPAEVCGTGAWWIVGTDRDRPEARLSSPVETRGFALCGPDAVRPSMSKSSL